MRETTGITYKGSVGVVQFESFNRIGIVNHGFSTKHGGVSNGCYATMNLSFARGDDEQLVKENFTRFARAIGVTYESLVLSDQIHETEVVAVTKEDVGRGLRTSKKEKYRGVDGLMTNEPEVTLTTFYADCVPLFFVDPVKKVVALSHAGWRGTVKGIAKKTIEAMKNEYGSKPEDIFVGIGPSIQDCCYEVSEDVINEFENQHNRAIIDKIATRKANSKYMLNLQEANKLLLLEVGVNKGNITISDLCTQCHSDDFFSHRVMGTERGSLAAMIALKA